MKIMMVCTSKAVKYSNTGTKRRIDTIAKLLSLSNKIIFLEPLPDAGKDVRLEGMDKFPFRQAFENDSLF